MITITLNQDHKYGCANEYTSTEDFKNERIPIERLASLTATGKDLQDIKDNFAGVVYVKHANSMSWYGDIARTILLNL